MGAAGRLTRSLAALTVVLGACSTSATDDVAPAADDLPAAPPVRDLQPVEPVVPDDGLHRLVVTIAAETVETPHSEAAVPDEGSNPDHVSEVPASPAVPEADSGTWNLTPDHVSAVPDGATLAAVNGVLGYRTTDGVFVPLDRPASPELQAEPSEEPADVTDGQRHADSESWLASIEGVQAVNRITDGRYAVVTSSVEPLQELGLDMVADAPFALTADPYEPYQWSLDNDGLTLTRIPSITPPDQLTDADVDGREARSAATGRGVVIAVIDSGVDFDHRDLRRSAWKNPGEDCGRRSGNGVDDDGNGFVDDCNGWDFGSNDGTGHVAGSSDHGTHVAGIIAASARNRFGVSGMAPKARIMDLKVDDSSGAISASSIARAIRYAVDNGADIVNLSLGSQPGAPFESVAAVAEAVQYAGNNGVLLVVAAGNNGQSLDSAPVYPASFNAPHMLVVAASGPSDALASFSNTGAPVDLMAPGELILSTVADDGLAFMSGTSQAAPMVAAAAALLLEKRPDAPPSAVIEQLLTSSDEVDADVAVPPRLNSARALGVEADDEAGGTVAIRNLLADESGRVDAEILFPATKRQFNQRFHWEASLVSLVDGAPYAVIDHPVTTGGGTDVVAGSTDGRGAVMLADSDARSAALSTELPEGIYALLIEAVPRTDSTVRLGHAHVALFTIGGVQHDPIAADVPVELPDNAAVGGEPPGVDIGDAADSPIDGEVDMATPSAAVTGVDDGDQTEPARGEEIQSPDDVTSSPTTASSSQGTDPTSTDGAGSNSDGVGESNEPVEDPPRGQEGVSTATTSSGGGSAEPPDTPATADTEAADPSGVGDSAAASEGSIEIGTDVATNGQWAITDMTPQTGPIDEETTVRISGRFPAEATVWFGDRPAEIVLSNDRLLVVRTPRHAEPQTVDVSLTTSADDVVLGLEAAFAFLRPGDDRPVVQTGGTIDVPVSTGSAAAGAETGSGGHEDAGFGLDPDDSVAEAPAPASGRGGRPDRSGGGRGGRNRQARAELTGAATTLPNGLTGVPLSGLDSVGRVPACNEALCRTRRV